MPDQSSDFMEWQDNQLTILSLQEKVADLEKKVGAVKAVVLPALRAGLEAADNLLSCLGDDDFPGLPDAIEQIRAAIAALEA